MYGDRGLYAQKRLKRKVECGGYATNFKWRAFEETNVCAKISRQAKDNNKNSRSNSNQQQPLPASHDKSIDSLIQAAMASTGFTQQQRQQEQKQPSPPPEQYQNDVPAVPVTCEMVSAKSIPSPSTMGDITDLPSLSPTFESTPTSSSCTRFESLSPTLSNMFGDNFIFNIPSPKDLDPLDKPKDENDVEEEVVNRKKSPSPGALISMAANNTTSKTFQNWIADFFDTSSRSSPFPSMGGIPQPLTDDHTKTINLFDRYTAGILSIKDGPTENPWRTVLLPLAHDHGALFHAVGAMTKFHNARQDQEMRAQAVQHMKQSFEMLGEGLNNKTLPPNVALATTISLAVAEGWDLTRYSTGISHLKRATKILRQLINQYKNMPLPPWLQFLFNSWLYYDVVARLTAEEEESPEERSLVEMTDDEDEEDDNDDKETNNQQQTPADLLETLLNNQVFDDSSPEASESPEPFPDHRKRRSSSNGSSTKRRRYSTAGRFVFKEHLFSSQKEEVDPLLGCGHTLFPLVGKVASLVQRVRKMDKNSLSIVSEAVELKHQLETWNTTLSKRMTLVEDPTWDLNSCLSTAEAYRYSALLYLHQAVPEVPSLRSHELAEKVMMLLASIPMSSGCRVVSIFPLLIAGCEAEGEERNWVLERWQMLSERMWIGNIDRTIDVVKEVWSRKDYCRRQREKKQAQEASESDKIIARRSSKDIASSIASRVAQAFGGTSDSTNDEDDLDYNNGIKGWCHWSMVMKEWGWEIILVQLTSGHLRCSKLPDGILDGFWGHAPRPPELASLEAMGSGRLVLFVEASQSHGGRG
ncbi:hypothetical protein TRICI_002716 [Trichomonascus ciferrii]|uniref:Transcription factor domain-containing protein n=1 Tax=Trichomonascus ciferrii TaxID=44093 RepID=A0A642V5U9_9ASCO|nr:hypothetical protein TRICI_002716 [Trichomonascus ciferrii]